MSYHEKNKFVEYECIKSELKDEYDRKIKNLNRRFQLNCQKDLGLDLLSKFDSIDEEMENSSSPHAVKNFRGAVTTTNRAKIYPPPNSDSVGLNYKVYLDNA